MDHAAVISGIGACLPEKALDNEMLAENLQVTDEWIRSRTGISSRRVVRSGMGISDLAVAAGRAALDSSAGKRVGSVLLATSTPDRKCPSTAPEVAWRLGLGEVPACDINAACSGFLYALANAQAQITSGFAETVLVIGADAYSTLVDPLDRSTAVLFGDGAGAVVLTRGSGSAPGAVVKMLVGSDGSGSEYAVVEAGGSRSPSAPASEDDQLRFLRLNGRQIYLQAIRRMTAAVHEVLRETGWDLADVAALVAHQANRRILDAVGQRLDLPAGRMISNIREVGNTAAASIPLAMAAAKDVPVGGRTVLAAFGAGLTWGAATLTWPEVVPVTSEPEPRSSRPADIRSTEGSSA